MRRASDRVEGVVERCFALQAERPPAVTEVALAELDPFLRGLLIGDGSVVRALAARTLSAVSAEPIWQGPGGVPRELIPCLETPPEEGVVVRRSRIGAGDPVVTLLCAESFLILDHLPPGFLGVLDGSPEGLGQTLARISLEHRRELLWFGLEATPEWAAAAGLGSPTLRRLSRIVSGGGLAILISEHFPVEQRGGVLGLAGLLSGEGAEGRTGGPS